MENNITDATIKVEEKAAVSASEKNICVQGLRSHSVTVFFSAYVLDIESWNC